MAAYFTPQAEIDLEEIGDYIALDNPRRAVTFIQEIRRHCEKIADAPMSHLAHPDLGDAIRICVHGNYLVVFVVLGWCSHPAHPPWRTASARNTRQSVTEDAGPGLD